MSSPEHSPVEEPAARDPGQRAVRQPEQPAARMPGQPAEQCAEQSDEKPPSPTAEVSGGAAAIRGTREAADEAAAAAAAAVGAVAAEAAAQVAVELVAGRLMAEVATGLAAEVAAEVAVNAAETAAAAEAAGAEFAGDFDDGDDVVWDDAQDNAYGAQDDAHIYAQDDVVDTHEQTPMQAGGAHDGAHAPEGDEFVISGHHEVVTCVGTGGPTATERRRLGSTVIELGVNCERPPTEQRRPSEAPSEQHQPAELCPPEHVIDLDDEIEAEIGLDESMDVTTVEVPRGGVGGGGGGGDDDGARGEGDGGGAGGGGEGEGDGGGAGGGEGGGFDETLSASMEGALLAMGFEVERVRIAIAACGDDQDATIQHLLDHANDPAPGAPTGDHAILIGELISMGFTRERVLKAIEACGPKVEECTQWLIDGAPAETPTAVRAGSGSGSASASVAAPSSSAAAAVGAAPSWSSVVVYSSTSSSTSDEDVEDPPLYNRVLQRAQPKGRPPSAALPVKASSKKRMAPADGAVGVATAALPAKASGKKRMAPADGAVGVATAALPAKASGKSRMAPADGADGGSHAAFASSGGEGSGSGLSTHVPYHVGQLVLGRWWAFPGQMPMPHQFWPAHVVAVNADDGTVDLEYEPDSDGASECFYSHVSLRYVKARPASVDDASSSVAIVPAIDCPEDPLIEIRRRKNITELKQLMIHLGLDQPLIPPRAKPKNPKPRPLPATSPAVRRLQRRGSAVVDPLQPFEIGFDFAFCGAPLAWQYLRIQDLLTSCYGATAAQDILFGRFCTFDGKLRRDPLELFVIATVGFTVIGAMYLRWQTCIAKGRQLVEVNFTAIAPEVESPDTIRRALESYAEVVAQLSMHNALLLAWHDPGTSTGTHREDTQWQRGESSGFGDVALAPPAHTAGFVLCVCEPRMNAWKHFQLAVAQAVDALVQADKQALKDVKTAATARVDAASRLADTTPPPKAEPGQCAPTPGRLIAIWGEMDAQFFVKRVDALREQVAGDSFANPTASHLRVPLPGVPEVKIEFSAVSTQAMPWFKPYSVAFRSQPVRALVWTGEVG